MQICLVSDEAPKQLSQSSAAEAVEHILMADQIAMGAPLPLSSLSPTECLPIPFPHHKNVLKSLLKS
jgi:hypothetical protein